jgi:regulator of sirC expression with transglutaminase-like and TPR domain
MQCQAWCSLSCEELAKRDLAEVNLAVASDLPQADLLDIPALSRELDNWTELVRVGTEKALRTRAKQLSYREYSDAQFRVLAMVTVLQRNLGVRYNFAFTRGEYDASDSRNLFVHGLLSGRGGTCVTMPVFYAAVARRLGYPVRLVCAKEHTFCRWDDSREERFNIEATSFGFASHSDEYYLTWPRPIFPSEIQRGWFMHNLSPREELAFFLGQRGNCCIDNLQMHRAVEAFHHADQLAPDDPVYHWKWGVSIILSRVVDEMRVNPTTNVCSMPPPREAWEVGLFPLAIRELNRVLRNRRAKQEAAAASQVFQEMAMT